MKKLLIASSAIVGVSMLAATAHAANVTAGGSYSFEVQMGGADNASDAMTFSGGTYDFSFSVEKTTDSGLTLTGASHIDSAGPGGAAVWDEAAAAIAGDFGTISFSNDGGGVAGMAPGANGLAASGDVDDFIKLGGAQTAGDRGVGASGNTFSYTSPNISGFKAGITLGRNGGNNEYDAAKEGDLSDIEYDRTWTRQHTPIDVAVEDDPNTKYVVEYGNDNFSENDYTETAIAPSFGNLDNINTEYTGIAFSYSIAGLTFGFAQGSQTKSIDVKGFTSTTETEVRDNDTVDPDDLTPETQTVEVFVTDEDGDPLTGDREGETEIITVAEQDARYEAARKKSVDEDGEDPDEEYAGNSTTTTTTDNTPLNGKYEETWSGTKLSIRYATGPFTVGYSATTIGEKEITVGGRKLPASTTAGGKADGEINETVIGVSYNYGAGTVSYVTASEDWASQSGDSAETLTTNLIAVSHSLGDGLSVYFENHAGSTESDSSNTAYESVSENVLGIKLTF